MLRPTILWSSLAAIAWTAALPSSATVMLKRDLAELTQGADAIVHGHVRKIEPRWSADHHRILTDIEIEVVESLKGQVPNWVTITQPGGQIGALSQRVDGTAHFEVGEEVVVFLAQHGPTYQLSGMAQGKLRVERSTDQTAAFVLAEPLSEVLLIDPSTHQATAANRGPIAFDELKHTLKAILAGSRGK